jgi:hypothetical protein
MALAAAGVTLKEVLPLAEGVSLVVTQHSSIPEPGAYRSSEGELVTYFSTCP